MVDTNDRTSPNSLFVTALDNTEQRAKIFAALSDPTRLRIVEMLALAETMSSSEIANQTGISLALFCHHSKILAEVGVIQTRKDGQTKYHCLNRGVLVNCFTSINGLDKG